MPETDGDAQAATRHVETTSSVEQQSELAGKWRVVQDHGAAPTGGRLWGLPELPNGDLWVDIAGAAVIARTPPKSITSHLAKQGPRRNPFPAANRFMYRLFWPMSEIREWREREDALVKPSPAPPHAGGPADVVPAAPAPETEPAPEATRNEIVQSAGTSATTLAGDHMFSWYTRCPECDLVSAPQSAGFAPRSRTDDRPDWTQPGTVRCGICGTNHTVTFQDLLPHDTVLTCVRGNQGGRECYAEMQVPMNAAQVDCPSCGLTQPGPSARVDTGIAQKTRLAVGRNTQELQATLNAAKARPRQRRELD